MKGFYLFEHAHVHKRSTSASETHHELLKNHPKVSLFICIRDDESAAFILFEYVAIVCRGYFCLFARRRQYVISNYDIRRCGLIIDSGVYENLMGVGERVAGNHDNAISITLTCSINFVTYAKTSVLCLLVDRLYCCVVAGSFNPFIFVCCFLVFVYGVSFLEHFPVVNIPFVGLRTIYLVGMSYKGLSIALWVVCLLRELT